MNRKISKIIKEWKGEAGLTINDIILISAYPSTRETLKICTNKPGLMIGKYGKLCDKYKEKLKEILPELESIEFVETDYWYIR